VNLIFICGNNELESHVVSKQNEPDFPLLKYLDSLVDSLRKLIASAVTGENEESVHHARVATRRLKAATDLLKPAISNRCRRPFNRVTRLLRRQLGPLRDLDVMIEHLAEFKQPKNQSAVEWLSARLGSLRQETVKNAAEQAPPARMLARLGTWWGLRHEIEESRDQIADLVAESVHLQLDAFVEQADDLVGARHNDPHQLRIAGKSLRYTLELAKENGARLPSSVGSQFKKMQTALGLWHDYIVLTERIMSESVASDLALHNPALQGDILGLAQTTLKRSESQMKKMATMWQTRGPSLTQTIRQAFPLTKHADVPEETEAPVIENSPTPIAESPSAPAA